MAGHIHGLVVYDSILFQRGHMVRRWADGVERTFTRLAIEEAPLNKRMHKGPGAPPRGTLKAGIHGSVTRVGPKHLQTDISSDAPYSLYVLKGVDHPIYPESAPWLKLPRNAVFGGGRRTRFYSVSGQSANNFLGRAAARTAVRHPSLRGFDHAIFQQT